MKKNSSNFDYRVDGINPSDVQAVEVPFRGSILSFSKPNTAALFLDYSYVLWLTSQHTFIEHKFIKDDRTTISVKAGLDEFQFFHILEQKMASIIFAYTALEAFANERIPDNFVYRKVNSGRKADEFYSKDQIERFVSLDTKLGDILPQIMGINTPRGTSIWEKYIHLKKLRDSIIHCKSLENSSGANQIFESILSETAINPCLEAKDVIGFFLNSLPEDKQPMWFKDFYKLEKETPKNFFELADFRKK